MHEDILDAPIAPAREPLVYTPGRERIIAGIADFLLLRIAGFVLSKVIVYIPDFYWVITAAVTGLELFFYVFLVKRHGGTPGKLFLNMQTVTADGSALTWYHVLVRYLPLFLIRLSSLIYLFWSSISAGLTEKIAINGIWLSIPGVLTLAWAVISTVVVLTDKKRRSLSDLIAGTVVVNRKK